MPHWTYHNSLSFTYVVAFFYPTILYLLTFYTQYQLCVTNCLLKRLSRVGLCCFNSCLTYSPTEYEGDVFWAVEIVNLFAVSICTFTYSGENSRKMRYWTAWKLPRQLLSTAQDKPCSFITPQLNYLLSFPYNCRNINSQPTPTTTTDFRSPASPYRRMRGVT